MPNNSIYEETNILLMDIINKNPEVLESSEIENLKEIIGFLTKLAIHDVSIAYLPYELSTISILEVALSMRSRKLKSLIVHRKTNNLK